MQTSSAVLGHFSVVGTDRHQISQDMWGKRGNLFVSEDFSAAAARCGGPTQRTGYIAPLGTAVTTLKRRPIRWGSEVTLNFNGQSIATSVKQLSCIAVCFELTAVSQGRLTRVAIASVSAEDRPLVWARSQRTRDPVLLTGPWHPSAILS